MGAMGALMMASAADDGDSRGRLRVDATMAMDGAEQREGARRWSASLAVAIAIHLLVAIMLWWSPRDVPLPPDPFPAEAIMLELAPSPQAPAALPSEMPPGPPQQEQSRSRARLEPMQHDDIAQPPTPAPAAEAPLRQAAARSAAAPDDAGPVEQTSVPPDIDAPRGERYAASQSLAGASQQSLVSWQSQLLGHLERFKRYPRTAQRQQQQGVVQVRYAVDRQGRVLRVALLQGSGHALLDQEALAAVQRASPLPPPPPDVPGDPVEVTTPVAFAITRR